MDIFVNMKNTYHISHLKFDSNNGWLFQSNEEHKKGVAELASQFAGEFESAFVVIENNSLDFDEKYEYEQ